MQTQRYFILSALLFIAGALSRRAEATTLSIGADYFLRSVSIAERDKTIKGNEYYDQRAIGYLTTDLSKDVEATLRVQSITPWGLENSTMPLATRYPEANGNLWLQNAFVRMPNIWKGRIIVTAGRQPLQWGDGEILADDSLGFDALRAQIKSPWRRIPLDLEGFTAKINEGLREPTDTDLHGVLLGIDRDNVRWELMGLWENAKGNQEFEMGGSTSPIGISKLQRQIYGVRFKVNLKDAYFKGAYYQQKGNVRYQEPGFKDITLSGEAYSFGLGGRSSTKKIVGRFGAFLEYALGSGDDVNTPNEDEAFRPTYASRWDGLERKGYGRYFASTFSDAYSPTDSFASASSLNDGLPEGTSGIQSIRFGVDSTPLAPLTLTFDYYQFKAQKNIVGKKELGVEFDYGLLYRYSGLVTLKAATCRFKPGEAFPEDFRKTAEFTSLELEIKF
ncbi:MAG: hypothetical protein LHV69_00375 [Elusimicrobia bacterium]|nr:hypothetical protein [Candidatus Obscuribacterium magneticum]MCB4755484.1 hypothetical protein [Candidatus Obscuribacterium magneticum]